MKKHKLLVIFVFCLSTLSFGAGANGFETSDLQGNWHVFGTEVNPNLPAVYWLYGDIDVDASGNISSGTYYLPDGSSITLTSGQFALDPKGVISGSFEAGALLSATVVNGKMDQNKTYGASVIIGSDNTMDFTTQIKGGGTFASTDIQGNWHTYNLVVDPNTSAVFWAYGILSVDGSGNITGTFYAPDGTPVTVTDGTAALDSEGMITGSYKLSTGDTVAISHGKLDQAKTFGVYVGVDPGTGTMGIVYLVKAGGTFQQQDGAGDWYVYGLAVDPSVPAVAWVYGKARIGASGNLNGFYILPTGDRIDVTGVSTIDNDGVWTGTFNLSTGDTVISPSTKLDQGKTSLVGVTINTDTGSLGLWQFIKGSFGALPAIPFLLFEDQ